MKIGIFLPTIEKSFLYKDFGQIALGLKDLGHDVVLITCKNKCIDPPLSIMEVKWGELESSEFYGNANLELMIFFSWLSVKMNKMVASAKEAGIKVIVKLDSDGRIAYPVFQSQLRGCFKFPMSFKEALKYLKVFAKWFLFGTVFVNRKVDQLVRADFAVVESPDAVSNISYFLLFNGRSDLIEKIKFIPNPVDDIFLCYIGKPKGNIIIAAGRWNDRSKNKEVLLKTMLGFSRLNGGWRFVILGSGSDYFSKKIKRMPESIGNMFTVESEVSHTKMTEYLSKSKILLMPSRWESFGIVAAEAAVCGCSIVGTPLDPLRFLTGGGLYGSISSNFSYRAVLASLVVEADRWESGERKAENISSYWVSVLNRKNIALMFDELVSRF